MFELDECQFDEAQIGAVWRQKQQLQFASTDEMAECALVLMQDIQTELLKLIAGHP